MGTLLGNDRSETGDMSFISLGGLLFSSECDILLFLLRLSSTEYFDCTASQYALYRACGDESSIGPSSPDKVWLFGYFSFSTFFCGFGLILVGVGNSLPPWPQGSSAGLVVEFTLGF